MDADEAVEMGVDQDEWLMLFLLYGKNWTRKDLETYRLGRWGKYGGLMATYERQPHWTDADSSAWRPLVPEGEG